MTKLTPDLASDLKAKITLAQNILILPHKDPDGDALGSALALQQVLISHFQKTCQVATPAPAPSLDFSFLPYFSKVINDFTPSDFDLIIFIDHSEFFRSGFLALHPDLPSLTKRLIVIDHHQTTQSTPDTPDSIIFSDPSSPSTSMILFELFTLWQISLTSDLSTCLLLGIITDTNSFKNTNTTPESLQIASHLISSGGNLSLITSELLHHKTSNSLQLWGRALSNLRVSKRGVAVSVLTAADFSETNTTSENLAGLINELLRAAKGARFAMLLTERDNQVKVSLRTASGSDFDVAKLAATFGGGGHSKAAGFFLSGHLKPITSWIITD